MGMPIKVPYTGITSLIVSGMRSEFLPFNISQKDMNMGTSIFKIALTEKKMKRINHLISFLIIQTEELIMGLKKEFELRNLKIKMPDKKEEKPKPVVKEKITCSGKENRATKACS
jgi:hypothetical protein